MANIVLLTVLGMLLWRAHEMNPGHFPDVIYDGAAAVLAPTPHWLTRARPRLRRP